MISEVEHAGVDLETLPQGSTLRVETGHHTYVIENHGKGKVLISGHPQFCPEPVEVDYYGAADGTSPVKMWRIVPGMRMAFNHPGFGIVRTSRVTRVEPGHATMRDKAA